MRKHGIAAFYNCTMMLIKIFNLFKDYEKLKELMVPTYHWLFLNFVQPRIYLDVNKSN